MHLVQRIKRFVNNLPLASKLELGLVTLTVLMLIVLSVAFSAAMRVYDEKISEGLRSQLELFSLQVERTFGEYDSLSAVIVSDSEFTDLLYRLDDAGEAGNSLLAEELRLVLLDRLQDCPNVMNLTYVSRRGTQVRAGMPIGAMGAERLERSRSTCRAAGGAYITIPPDDQYPYLQGGRHLFRPTGGVPADLGDFILTIDLWEVVNELMATTSNTPSVFIISSGDEALYVSDAAMQKLESELSELPSTYYGVCSLGGSSYYVSRMESATEGWVYTAMMRSEDVSGPINAIRMTVWATVLLIGLAAIPVARYVARAVTRPIGQLLISIQAAGKGRFTEAQDISPEITSHDEIGALTRAFAEMLAAIDALVVENYEKQLLFQRTRYRMLRAQINPHFLYNTLGTVNWLIRLDKKDEAVRVVTALSDVLRHALSRDEHSTATDEVAILRRYISIQETRFGSRIHVVVATAGDLDAYLLPHFTLQPLVENALTYGAEAKDGVCTIRVSLIDDGSCLQITVTDDGSGMSAERLEEVRSFSSEGKGHGIGLKNIHDRLELMYQGRQTFQIDSEPEKGCTVRITVPRTDSVSHLDT